MTQWRWILPQHKLDRWMAIGGLAMIPAMLWLVATLLWFNSIGLLTAFFAVYLGACVGSLLKYQKERGLWMLAAMGLIFTVPFWVLGTWGSIFQSGSPISASDVIDVMGFTLVAGITSRILASVFVHNRALGKS